MNGALMPNALLFCATAEDRYNDNRKHSFVHYEDLYSASSRLGLLLRRPSDPCTAKKNSFETRVECARMKPGEQLQFQGKPILHEGANHRECKGLPLVTLKQVLHKATDEIYLFILITCCIFCCRSRMLLLNCIS